MVICLSIYKQRNSKGCLGAPDFEVQHRLDAVAVILKLLVGLIFGLAAIGGPDLDQIFAGFTAPVEIIPVMLERQYQPFFERQRLGRFAVLHFMGRVVVADPLFWSSSSTTPM